MVDKFISAITDEAMQRICYNGGGWELTPYRFAVSSTDVLEGITVYSGNAVTEEAQTKLKELTSNYMNSDSGVWCELPFSSLIQDQQNKNVLQHHLIIPATQSSSEKTIKTIYFIYSPHEGNPFLYAVAYAPTAITFEPGVTQSFFFNFKVTNGDNDNDATYVINYTYPQEIDDHNNDLTAHGSLFNNCIMRDGTKTITGTLMYSGDRTFTNDFQLVSKGYVDNIINTLKSNNHLT